MSDRHGRPGGRAGRAAGRADATVPALSLRELNRTTLLRQSLLAGSVNPDCRGFARRSTRSTIAFGGSAAPMIVS